MAKPGTRSRQPEAEVTFSGRAVMSGLVGALVTVLLGAVVLSLSAGARLAGSPWEPLALTVVQVLAYGVAGMVAGIRARSWGWLHGTLAAVAWVVIALIFQLIAFPHAPSFGAIVYQGLLAAAVGALSGMLGVNL